MTISRGDEAPENGFDENGILIGEEQGSYDDHGYVQASTDRQTSVCVGTSDYQVQVVEGGSEPWASDHFE